MTTKKRNPKHRKTKANYQAVAERSFWGYSPIMDARWFFKEGQSYFIKEIDGIKAVYGGGKPIVLVDSSVYIDNFKLIYA